MKLTCAVAVWIARLGLVAGDGLSFCCNALAAAGLGNGIVASGVQAYEASVQKYFSLTADLRPQCFLQPKDTNEVSLAVKTLLAANGTQPCQFAVRSGGHMHFPGAAGIENGVTIDLGLLKEINYFQSNSSVSVGPGAVWGDVYSALDKLGVMVVGGRSTTIGVGGLTLGGGNSYYAARKGLACDNVLRFEIVLGDGSIATASASERPDLFQALKGSSNNLGIVTRFDLEAFDNGNGTIFGGVVLYPGDQATADKQLEAMVDFGEHIKDDPYGSAILISIYFSTDKQPKFMNAYDYTRPGANRSDAEPVFKQFWAIPGNVSDSTAQRNMTSLAHEFEVPKDHRVSFSTYTFKNDIRVMKKAHETFLKVTEKLSTEAHGDYGLYLLYQPIPTLFAEHGLEKGGNVLGLDRFNDTQILLEPYLKWQGADQDELFQGQAKFIRDEVSTFARSIGADSPWLYLNYADKDQNPLEGYGPENVARIQAASAKYDPQGVFQYMMPGGFKISSVEREENYNSKTPAGAIAGGVVGGVAAVIIACIVGWVVWKRRKVDATEPRTTQLLSPGSPPSEMAKASNSS